MDGLSVRILRLVGFRKLRVLGRALRYTRSGAYARCCRRLACGNMLFAATLCPAYAQPASSDAVPMVMGIDVEKNFVRPWMRAVFEGAFRRLDLQMSLRYVPTKRLSVLVDEGELDGEVLRAPNYGVAHPNLMRVDAPIVEVQVVLLTARSEFKVESVDALAHSEWRVGFRRGMAICEQPLRAAGAMSDSSAVTTSEEGARMLLAGRIDLYCDVDLGMQAALSTHPAKDREAIRQVFELGPALPLYPYLHKKHAALVPRLATALQAMRKEGLIDTLRRAAEEGKLPVE